jgi:hypothetical protein
MIFTEHGISKILQFQYEIDLTVIKVICYILIAYSKSLKSGV